MIDDIDLMDKGQEEYSDITKSIIQVFYNLDSPYCRLIPADTIYVPSREDYGFDFSGMTVDGKKVFGEVKKLNRPLFVDGQYNPYFMLSGKTNYTFDNCPDENDQITPGTYTGTTGHHPFNANAYNTAITGYNLTEPFYYINAASGKDAEHIFGKQCKLYKMYHGNWHFIIKFDDGCLYFTPDLFKNNLSKYIRRYSSHTTEKALNGYRFYSWELKRMLKLEGGVWLPFK